MIKSNFPVLLIVAALSFSACKKSAVTDIAPTVTDTTTVKPPPVVTVPSAVYDLSLLTKCTLFENVPTTGIMTRQDYKELSGIAESRKTPGVLYVFNDGSSANEVYLTNKAGADLGKLILDGVTPRDWEDMATGPGPDAGKTYVYMADIGDNNASYKSVTIYRFAEPDLSTATSATAIHITAIDKIQVAYSRGATNAETLLIDPLTKDLIIATKETSKSYLYVIPYPQSTNTVTTVTPSAMIGFDLLNSGDISPDGSEVLLRDAAQIWYWKRVAGESTITMLLRKPQDAPYAANEHQGEGICFATDGGGYYTDSEIRDYPGAVATISFYKRK